MQEAHTPRVAFLLAAAVALACSIAAGLNHEYHSGMFAAGIALECSIVYVVLELRASRSALPRWSELIGRYTDR